MGIPTTSATQTTTSTDPREMGDAHHALSRSSRLVLVTALGLGLVLITLGTPRFLGALAFQPARAVLTALREGRGLPPEIIERGDRALESSMRWPGTPAHVLSDLALLKLLRVQPGLREDVVDRASRVALREAIERQEESLRRAPAGSNGWGRLAYAYYVESGLSPATRNALEMSLRTGGLDLPLLSFRLQLILEEWETLEPELPEAAEDEILRMARYGRIGFDALAAIYLRSSHAEIIDAVMERFPEHRALFARSLAHTRDGG